MSEKNWLFYLLVVNVLCGIIYLYVQVKFLSLYPQNFIAFVFYFYLISFIFKKLIK